MNRKDFLSVAIPAGLTLGALKSQAAPALPQPGSLKTPPYLVPGDTIGITSPAGFITLEDIQPAVLQMESWGFKIKTGNTIGKQSFTFGGTDEERRADLQQMLDDPEIKAIMCARGGYGAVRIIDLLDFSTFKRRPKWIIGFSDITVLHCHINKHYGIPTIHSKMCNSFPSDWTKAEPIQVETILSIKSALIGEQMKYTAPASLFNKKGKASGKLIGGNLRTIENLAGTNSQISTKGKLLFVEDTGEYLYSVDRMFRNLKRTGLLKDLAGLIVGGFKLPPETAGEEFGQTVYEIVTELTKEYQYPVAFDFPVGHQRNNFALKCGIQHHIDVNDSGTFLEQHVSVRDIISVLKRD